MELRISAYILCGGKSSRMQMEKGMVCYQNSPFIQHIINAVKPLTGNGLLTNTSGNWHTQRKLMAPSFHFRQIARMIDIMVEETEVLIHQWQGAVGKERNISEDMMFLTLNIVSRALFSTDVMSAAGQISDSVRDAFAYAGYKLNHPFSLGEMISGKRKGDFPQSETTA